MKNLSILLVLLTGFLFSCEDMEDTFDGGDGVIRYVGKCKNLTIETGWKRVVLNWENSLDATVKNVKVVWTVDEKKDSVLLPGDATTYETPANLINKVYTFDLYAVDKNGKHSIKITNYGRPFTADHEKVSGYGKIEKKYVFVKDKLLLFFNDNLEEVKNKKLKYFSGGKQKTLAITKEILANGWIKLDNVDTNKDVTFTRSANIDGCIDIVNFDPYKLDREFVTFNSVFEDYLKANYGLKEVTRAWINSQEELFFDYDLVTLEDILYFPNLKKLILGSHRYMQGGDKKSSLDDKATSLLALKLAREVSGLDIEIYNDHFEIAGELPFAKKKGNPKLPDYTPLNTEGWTIELKTNDEKVKDFDGKVLLDNNGGTVWSSQMSFAKKKIHEFKLDMKSNKSVNGFVVRQPGQPTFIYRPGSLSKNLKILVSNDGQNWRDAFFFREITIGDNNGEVTMIKFSKKENFRYVKFTTKDGDHGGPFKKTHLADFVVY